jgi:hypothetical protein
MGLPDLRWWGLADPPVKGATAQPGAQNASTSAKRAAQMQPTPLSDSEATQMAST